MAVETTAKPNGLKTVLDTIVAPKDAMESLRVAPTWGWALLLALVLTMLALYLETPANVHAVTANWPNTVAQSPQLAAQSPEQQQTALAFGIKITQFIWLFAPIGIFIAVLLGTIIMVIFNAIGRGSASFGQYWAAQWNIAVLGAIGAIVQAVIVLARGADSFSTPAAVQSAMPGLAMLVPESAVKLHAFFSVFTVFGIWMAGLSIVSLSVIGRVGKVPAWLGGSLTLVIGGLIVAALAK